MSIIVDCYFWKAMAYSVAGCSAAAALVAACFRYKRFGKILFVLFIVVGCTYDLVQCSNLLAYGMRPTTLQR